MADGLSDSAGLLPFGGSKILSRPIGANKSAPPPADSPCSNRIRHSGGSSDMALLPGLICTVSGCKNCSELDRESGLSDVNGGGWWRIEEAAGDSSSVLRDAQTVSSAVDGRDGRELSFCR